MSDLSSRIAALPPEKRLLLELMRKEQRGETSEPSAGSGSNEDPRTQPFSLISAEDRQRLPDTIEDAYPLSAAQIGMLFHMQVDLNVPSPPAYHNVNSFHLEFTFELESFQAAVDHVVARHPTLRTSFDLTSYSQPLQLVHRSAHLPVHYTDLSHLSPEAQQKTFDIFLRSENFRLLDLSKPPLLRFHVHRLTDETLMFTLTEPHSISDGWSTHLTLVEIFQSYLALLNDEPLPNETLPAVSYRDYIYLERKALQSPEAQQFWAQKLGDATVVKLPRWPQAFRSQAVLGDHKLYRKIDPAVVEKLHRLSRSASVPFKSVLLATHLKVLSLITGQAEVMTGIALNGRPEVTDGDKVRGLFLNTLPLRASLAPSSWLDLIQQAYRAEVEMLPYRRYPLATLQHNWGSQPLFEVGFHFHHFHSVQQMLRSGKITVLEGGTDFSTTNFPIGVSFSLNPLSSTELAVILEYDVGEFAKEQILAMHEYYVEVLEAISQDPTADHTARTYLSPTERQQILQTWNETATALNDNQCVHELFAAQVARRPEAIAAVAGNASLSYQELDRRTDLLARALQARGVGPDVNVGICMDRSLELIVGLLGILKAGGVYVPMDPAYPKERLGFIIDDARLSILLTQQALLEVLPDHNTQVLCLDSQWGQIEGASVPPLTQQVTPDNLAYIIYTSGSTGQPKGAMIPHRGIVNTLLWRQQVYPLSEQDRVLQTTSLSFDASVWEFFGPLVAGAQLVLSLPRGQQGMSQLGELVDRHGVTMLQLPPSLLQVFLEEQTLDRCRSLRQVFCGGEALPARVQERFFSQLNAKLDNLYGPTEASLDVSFWSCQPGSDYRTAPIGRPIANKQLYILDATLHPVPVGVPGELFIGGWGLARGYFNRPDLTAAAFIPNPFGDQPGERLYRTGDLATYLPDGNIEFLGRIDNQVKVRGFRIELEEIEAVLESHAMVQEAVVLAREDQPGIKRLVAYVVPAVHESSGQNGHTPKTQLVKEIQETLKEQLPHYMVPAAFVVLDALPLNPNGKVDRKALPAPAVEQPETREDYVAPRNEIEARLASLWQDVLRVPAVSIHDNFFELGGDSILSIQVVARANQAGLRLTPTQIFRFQTIANLAEVVDTAPVIQAEQGIVTGPVPLTPIQQWFFEQNFDEPHHWNQAVLLEVRRPLDATVLEEIFQHLVVVHDALRLRFTQTEAGWQQYNAAPDEPLTLTRIDLGGVAPDQQQAAMQAAAAKLQGSLDLERGPLVRVALIEMGAGRPSYLLVVAHHLTVDGISWRTLLADLHMALEQSSQGKPIMLPPKTTSFKQWAERLESFVASGALNEELPYWLDSARQEVAPVAVDFEAGRSANSIASMDAVGISLSAEETRALLQDVPAAYNTQINDVLLTALGQAFAKWGGSPLLLVDMEGHGREELFEDIDLSRTVGWFTTIYPVLIDLRGTVDQPGEALKGVKEQLRQLPKSGIGYGLLRRMSPDPAVRAALGALRAPEVSFNYLGQLDQILPDASPFGPTEETAGPLYSSAGNRTHILVISASIGGGQLHTEWFYSSNLHERDTIRRLARAFIASLQELIAHCTTLETKGYTPSDFPDADLSPEELDSLIAGLSGFEE